MKIKQLTDIKYIRLIKIFQILLFLLGHVILLKHLPSLFSYIIMAIILLLGILVPKDYQWGIGAKKSIFSKNGSPIIESVLIFIVVMVIVLFISWVIWYLN